MHVPAPAIVAARAIKPVSARFTGFGRAEELRDAGPRIGEGFKEKQIALRTRGQVFERNAIGQGNAGCAEAWQ